MLGLTPHAVRVKEHVSAVWSVVEAWQGDRDATGRPYRDLIYAVFPGFEPSLNDGKQGLHVLCLFDPTIGQDRFLGLFSAVMGGVTPWQDGQLRITQHDFEALTKLLDDCKFRENPRPGQPGDRWDFLLLAPHAFAEKGLFGAAKAQVLEALPNSRLAGIELGDNELPEDAVKRRDWLLPAMKAHRHAFFHASDAYGTAGAPTSTDLYEVGSRFTLVKLATPSVMALRQSFLASDARMRLAFERAPSGPPGLTVRGDLPEPFPAKRPWVRSVAIQGGTSFHKDLTFRFSPDLTCLIGGSMTGKSTLLDGLRHDLLGPEGLPDAKTPLGASARGRVRDRFLSGGARVTVESPALDQSLPVRERLRPQFFGQGELQELSRDPERVEHLLFHLVPGRGESLLRQRSELRAIDEELDRTVPTLRELARKVAEAEQALARANEARRAMDRFAAAGTEALQAAQQDRSRADGFAEALTARASALDELIRAFEGLSLPALLDPQLAGQLSGAAGAASSAELLAEACTALARARANLAELLERAQATSGAAEARSREQTQSVQDRLVAAGGSASDLNAFESFARAANLQDAYVAAHAEQVTARDGARARFARQVRARATLVGEHRAAVAEIAAEVARRFEGRVTVLVEEEGRRDRLGEWVRGLKHPGLTRWWNDSGATRARASELQAIARAVEAQELDLAVRLGAPLGMSEAVTRSLLEQLGQAERRLELDAIRAPDRYTLQWHEGEGVVRRLDDLSGGRRVAVLLTLLLESDDPAPLIVDQPEDELDNRFLLDTIIPALHRLKGRRQVIFATHNANLVVNGDADLVIALESDAHRARIGAEGAIEAPEVRAAIVRTLDGGEEAFRLRRAKYGL